jgi:hypothetical protein
MSKRNIIIGAAAVVVVVAWAAFRPDKLFSSSRIDEPLSIAASVTQPGSSAMAAPEVLLNGVFHTNAHKTTGSAMVYRRPDGARFLRLADFVTSDGPDVHVYLVAASDVQKDGVVKQAGFVDLGSLKATQGNQNYIIPIDVDLATYRAATIWCKRFSVNFGSAPLKVASAAM